MEQVEDHHVAEFISVETNIEGSRVKALGITKMKTVQEARMLLEDEDVRREDDLLIFACRHVAGMQEITRSLPDDLIELIFKSMNAFDFIRNDATKKLGWSKAEHHRARAGVYEIRARQMMSVIFKLADSDGNGALNF